MTPREIARAARTIFDRENSNVLNLNRRITNEIFLVIEKNDYLKGHYEAAVERSAIGTVNRSIGKEVKEMYNLTNANERERNPSSKLIKSHQIFV